MLVFRIGDNAAFRYSLYPTLSQPGEWISDHVPNSSWNPGDTLDILGPIGTGFTPPGHARRWLLLAFSGLGEFFRPLIATGLQAGKEISLWSLTKTIHPPPQVEVLAEPESALDWAEFIGISCAANDLEFARQMLTPLVGMKKMSIQILLVHPMPCGFGFCGACAVVTQNGVSFTCVDGPIYSFQELMS